MLIRVQERTAREDRAEFLLLVDYGSDGWRIEGRSDDPRKLLSEAMERGLPGPFMIVKVIKFEAVD